MADGTTVEAIKSDNLLHVIDGLQPCPHDTVINQDFNLKVRYVPVTKQVQFWIDETPLNIPATKLNSSKTFCIKNINQSISAWGSWLFNNTYYCAYISKMVEDGTQQVRTKSGLGKFPALDMTEDEILVAMVRLDVADSFENTSTSNLTFYRLWKKGLAPAEKRITISESQSIHPDKYTIDKNYQGQLSIPALQIGHKVNMFLLKDFDFNITAAGSDISITPRGGNQAIPILVDGVRKYMRVAYWTLGTSNFGSNMTGKWAYWTVGATITDTESTSGGMTTYTQPSGAMVEFRPEDIVSKVRILTVLAYVPDTGQGESWDLSKIYMFKHWKNMLAPFDELWNEKVTP